MWKSKKMKRDKYIDLPRELKKLWNMKMTVIPVIVGALGKWDWKSWKSEVELRPSKLQHSKDRPEYWEEFWRSEETCGHSDYSERQSANAYLEKLLLLLIIIIIIPKKISVLNITHEKMTCR